MSFKSVSRFDSLYELTWIERCWDGWASSGAWCQSPAPPSLSSRRGSLTGRSPWRPLPGPLSPAISDLGSPRMESPNGHLIKREEVKLCFSCPCFAFQFWLSCSLCVPLDRPELAGFFQTPPARRENYCFVFCILYCNEFVNFANWNNRQLFHHINCPEIMRCFIVQFSQVQCYGISK